MTDNNNARQRLESMSRLQLLSLVTKIGEIAITSEDARDAVLEICNRLKVSPDGNLDQLRADDAAPPAFDLDTAFAIVANGSSFQVVHPPHVVPGEKTINEPIYIVSQRDLHKVSDAVRYPVTIGSDAENDARRRIAEKLDMLKVKSRAFPQTMLNLLDAMIGLANRSVTFREPKTSDYCRKCGESPESATHWPPVLDHEYQDPRAVGRFAELAAAWRKDPTGDPNVIEPILNAAASELAAAEVLMHAAEAKEQAATATASATVTNAGPGSSIIGEITSQSLDPTRKSDLEGVYWIVANGGAYQVVNPPHPVGADAINEPIYVCRGRDLRAAADAFAGERASPEEDPHGPFVAAFPIPMPGFHAMPGGMAGVTVQRTWSGPGPGAGPTGSAPSPFAQSLAELARPTRTLESTREAIARLFVACATTRNVGELIRHFIVLDDPTHAVTVSFDSDGIRERKMVVKLGLSDTEAAELNRIAHGITHGGTTR